MRLTRSTLLAAAFVSAFLSAGSASAGRGSDFTGQAAPELQLSDGLNGASAATTIASLRGKVVCLKFWLTRCPVCRGTLPEFQGLQDRYGRSGVVCLGVVIDDAAGVGPYLREAGWTFPVGCDPDHRNATKYGVSGYPADYVIGIDGVVRASNGFRRDVIEDELRKLRMIELGTVPTGAETVRDAVEENDYGTALRRAEGLAAAAGATADVKAFATRVAAIARKRLDNRFARADALRQNGHVVEAKAELEKIVLDFKGTTLEAVAKQRLDGFGR